MGIDPAGVKYVMNPYDEIALEKALRLREKAGDGLVTVLSVGPEESKEILRTALAMGADEAVLLASPESADGLVIARALAEEIGDREYDLILFGKQAIDDDNMQVPAMVAELLRVPCASVVVQLQVEGRHVVAHREIEGGHEIVEFDLPAVVGAQKGLNEPRYPSLKGNHGREEEAPRGEGDRLGRAQGPNRGAAGAAAEGWGGGRRRRSGSGAGAGAPTPRSGTHLRSVSR